MLPSACGLGQHFQDLGHSFSLYGPPSRQITGINVGEKVIKVSLYADDTTVFVRDLDSVAHLLTLLQKFKNLSGLEINTTNLD